MERGLLTVCTLPLQALPRHPALRRTLACVTQLGPHTTLRAAPGSGQNRPGANLLCVLQVECGSRSPATVATIPRLAFLRQMSWEEGRDLPAPFLLARRQSRCGLVWKPSFPQNHCCSGACLGDGAVVTTTVDTALEELEAVPC